MLKSAACLNRGDIVRIVILIITLLLMQVFTFGLGRSVQWLLAGFIGTRGRRWLMAGVFAITNALIAGLLLQLGHAVFRLMAVWMVALLFAMYAALATFVLYLILCRVMPQKPVARSLRIFAPLFFIGLTAYSVYNAYTPVVRHYEISINKKLERPLRIGFVSGDLREHAVAYFMEPMLAALGQHGLNLTAYSNRAHEDAVSTRLRQLVHGWHKVAGWSDARLAAQIQADRIDILVDLKGHTGMARTGTIWRCEAEGVTPDILTYGKAFGGGVMPITGIICRPHLWTQQLVDNPWLLGSPTFGGNPVCAAAALATIKYMLDNDIAGECRRKGELMKKGLNEILAK